MLTDLHISRPRFWVYVFGPYLIGLAAAWHGDFSQISLAALLLGVYFTFPANLLIYGINDIFDYDTDVINGKKTGYEILVDRAYHKHLVRLMVCVNAPILVCLFIFPWSVNLALLSFLLLGIFYSAPPIRAKGRPLLDSAFNILYVMPGLAGFFAFGGEQLSWSLVAAAMLWSIAMHAYSAVPDIQADKQAKIATIATTLGKHGTLGVCLLLYSISGAITAQTLGFIGWLGLGVYASLMLWSVHARTPDQLLKIYKLFPAINSLMGAGLFLTIVLQRL